MAGSVPTGVMAMHKVLLTAESPQNVADTVQACKVTPTGGSGAGNQELRSSSIGTMSVNVPSGPADPKGREVVAGHH